MLRPAAFVLQEMVNAAPDVARRRRAARDAECVLDGIQLRTHLDFTVAVNGRHARRDRRHDLRVEQPEVPLGAVAVPDRRGRFGEGRGTGRLARQRVYERRTYRRRHQSAPTFPPAPRAVRTSSARRIARVTVSGPASSTLCASFAPVASKTASANAVASGTAVSSPAATARRNASASALGSCCRAEQIAASDGISRNSGGRCVSPYSSDCRGIPTDASSGPLFNSRRLHNDINGLRIVSDDSQGRWRPKRRPEAAGTRSRWLPRPLRPCGCISASSRTTCDRRAAGS